jgi:hypothetical protein
MVVCQTPVAGHASQRRPTMAETLMPDYGKGTRLVLVRPNQALTVLTEGFHSACDPDIAFDARSLLFAGKRRASDHWAIFEMSLDSYEARQITRNLGDCRQPGYQATFYTIISPKPWYQLTFVRLDHATLNEFSGGPSTHLYSCKLDGTAVRRLTYNLSCDVDPFLKSDGRMVYAAWQRSQLNHGPAGRVSLFDVNTDGADAAALCTNQGKRIKHMPCATADSLLIFVESDGPTEDGSGSLGSVQLRRPLHSYRAVTGPVQGRFHSPSPLPDGRILVSHRTLGKAVSHGVCTLDPATGQTQRIFDDPAYHDIQARAVYARAEPDGRSSVVTEEDPFAKLYCLNVYLNDWQAGEGLPPGSVKRLRVLEGIPIPCRTAHTNSMNPLPTGPLAQRRILGEVDVATDGSFQVEIPASIPIELQILDEDGLALNTCSWIWAKNHEPRGCIGCHEDGELTPENLLVEAVAQTPKKLTLAPEQRRTVDFCRDVAPILRDRCSKCHQARQPHMAIGSGAIQRGRGAAYDTYLSLLARDDTGQYKYVQPGRARTSLMIWRVMGRVTSRPWDQVDTAENPDLGRMPPQEAEALTQAQKQILIEWIDLGAAWDGIPAVESDVVQ